MDLRTMDDVELDRAVRKLFGDALPWDRKGAQCLVHMDRPAEARRRARVERFRATDLFDPACPHCRPLLDEGTFVVFDGVGTVGLRPLPDGRVELVVSRLPPMN
jgi:hypothetical protein